MNEARERSSEQEPANGQADTSFDLLQVFSPDGLSPAGAHFLSKRLVAQLLVVSN
jgi:hypothetical protein